MFIAMVVRGLGVGRLGVIYNFTLNLAVNSELAQNASLPYICSTQHFAHTPERNWLMERVTHSWPR